MVMDIRAPQAVMDCARSVEMSSGDVVGSTDELVLTQYLTFRIGQTTLGMPISSTREIIEFGQITSVPLMPPFLLGVINLRGAVVPVVDLAKRLGLQTHERSKRVCIVIVEMQTEDEWHPLGVVVDSVSEVLELSTADLEPSPRFGAHIRADFIDAMAKVKGQFVVLISLEQVLSIPELAEQVRAGEASFLCRQKRIGRAQQGVSHV